MSFFETTDPDHYLGVRTHKTIELRFSRKYGKDCLNNLATLSPRADFQEAVERSLSKSLHLFLLSREATSHEEVARKKLGSGKIAFMQGCGDLTMNEWNVAFVSGPSCQHERRWDLLHAPDEPLTDREYSCFIKWSVPKEDLAAVASAERVVYPYQVANLKFLAPSLDRAGSPDRHVFMGSVPIGHLIEFAVYGKQMFAPADLRSEDTQSMERRLRSGVLQFSDVRHLFHLPNLNPPEPLTGSDPALKQLGIGEYQTVPRLLFNEPTYDDVWLGEKGLIQGDRNLRRAALRGAIQLNAKALGAPAEWIKFVLRASSTYKETPASELKPDSELKPGEWRWIKEGREEWLEIFFKPNHFPCSIVGVTAKDEIGGQAKITGSVVDTEKVYFSVHGHNYNTSGCTIMEAAEFVRERNAASILVIDEGTDVFQMVSPVVFRQDSAGGTTRKLETVPLTGGGELVMTVPLRRAQLRCVFWAEP